MSITQKILQASVLMLCGIVQQLCSQCCPPHIQGIPCGPQHAVGVPYMQHPPPNPYANCNPCAAPIPGQPVHHPASMHPPCSTPPPGYPNGPGTPCGHPTPCCAPSVPTDDYNQCCGPCMPTYHPCGAVPFVCPPGPPCHNPGLEVCEEPPACARIVCPYYSEFYVGAIGMGISFDTNHSGRGFDDLFGSGQCKSRLNDTLWGVVAGYTFRKPCGVYFNAEFDWAAGDVGDRHRRFIEDIPGRHVNHYYGTGRLGWNFNLNGCALLTPYGGVGYRFIDNNIWDTSEHLHYKNWFAIVGLRLDRRLNSCFTIGIKGEWLIPFNSRISIGNFSRDFDQNTRQAFDVELPLRFTFHACCREFAIVLAPFYRRIANRQSREFTCDIETFRIPSLTTQEYGGKLYWSILF